MSSVHREQTFGRDAAAARSAYKADFPIVAPMSALSEAFFSVTRVTRFETALLATGQQFALIIVRCFYS